MSALRNLLKSDTPSSPTGGNSGRVEGQGSHFPKSEQTALQPDTVTGTEPNTAGPSDISAAPAPASQAQATAGPEAGGNEHVNTVSADQASASGNSVSQAPATGSSAEFPSVQQSSKDGSGSAVVGSTSTYSSQPLASGDPTGSIIDHKSTDPLTYKLPEAGSHNTSSIGNAGVPPEAAATAASVAWKNNETTEIMPGGFPTTPGYENPYKASQPLDPRVDGGRAGDIPASAASHTSQAPVAGMGVSGVGEGAAAAGAAAALKAHEQSAQAPSTLTTTADPADRSPEYSKTTDLKGMGSDPEQSQQSGGFLGKALGAVGLGGAAAALGLAKKDSTDEPHDETAVATQPGLSSQESGPPKHYRRESIPTTAYPGGVNSPAAVAPPIGGTQAPTTASADHKDHIARDGALAAGIGGGAVAASDFSASKTLRENVTGEQNSTSQHPSGLGLGSQTSGVPPSEYQDSQKLRDSAVTGTGGSTVHDLTTKSPEDSSHTGRNLAAAGVTSAAIGTGAYALHEHDKDASAPEAVAPVAHAPTTAGTEAAPVATSAGASTVMPTTAAPSAAVPEQAAPVSRAPTTSVAGETVPATAAAATTLPDRTRETTITDPSTDPAKEDHTARNAALGAGAGAAVAGGAAYAYDEHKEKEALEAQKQHQKELEKAEKQHEKEVEKEQKQHEKEEKKHQKELEKEEKKHQKELEKEEKKHAKEAEKEEKKHQKELEKEEKKQAKEAEKEEKKHEAELLAAQQREEARRVAEDEDRMRREREAAAALTTGAVAGSAASGAFHGNDERPGAGPGEPGYEAQQEHDRKEKEKEKKPNIFKRIFKRRKNKDTGEDEEYSTDDEEDKQRNALAAARVVAENDHSPRESRVPHHESESKGRNVLGKDPRKSTELPHEKTTGLPYDPAKDPETAQRLSTDAGTAAIAPTGRSAETTPATTTEAEATKVNEPGVTTAAHTGTGVVDTPAGGHIPATATEPFGEVMDHRR